MSLSADTCERRASKVVASNSSGGFVAYINTTTATITPIAATITNLKRTAHPRIPPTARATHAIADGYSPKWNRNIGSLCWMHTVREGRVHARHIHGRSGSGTLPNHSSRRRGTLAAVDPRDH